MQIGQYYPCGMLDNGTGKLLKKLNALCEEEGYQIVEEEELLGGDGDRAVLQNKLEFLQKGGYLDVRYAQDGVYCLCLLPEGRGYFERELKERLLSQKRERRLCFVTLCASLIGTLLAHLLLLAVAFLRD